MTPLADCPQRFGPAVSFYLAQHLLATLLPDPAIHHLVQLRFSAPFSDGSIRRSLSLRLLHNPVAPNSVT
jgi:hypothetical protein